MRVPAIPTVAASVLLACAVLATPLPAADVPKDDPRAASAESQKTVEPAALMPRVSDYTSMWWAEGFPACVASAPWRRCIQTGSYAIVLDTESLRIPHLGPVPPGTSYSQCGRGSDTAWKDLPSAELTLQIKVNGKTYHGAEGGKWTQFTGPRLIESGRFMQRADVTDLVFKSADGEPLNVEARLETAAWPDRLGLILAARPGLVPGTKLGEQWKLAEMEIGLRTAKGVLQHHWELPTGRAWPAREWNDVFLAFNPSSFQAEEVTSRLSVQAEELSNGRTLPVDFAAARGWHRVDLDGIEPTLPPSGSGTQNDSLERIRLLLSNPTEREQVARLLFEKHGNGIRQRIGSAITGVSAILRDTEGQPTGIPVQLSKNWHNRPEGGVYAGGWFHGFSQIRLPAGAEIELELTLAYGHWGGVAAASHAQLCLIGWGSNQRWDESALGSWGESICYEPDQVQAHASILDVRPVMVRSMSNDSPWTWTHNVGGGDYFRLFDTAGERISHASMRAAYERYGPCLTEVTYSGRLAKGIRHAATVSLARSDDLVRGTYRLRMDVNQTVDFSRFVILQIGADTYSYTGERKMALGNETGLLKEWATQWGGDIYRTKAMECTGRVPWLSLHEAVPRLKDGKRGAWANRGLVIRSWKAHLGGKPASVWIAERGVKARGSDTSTLDIVPPPGVTRLEPGDFVEATIQHIVMPQFAADYYGPNEALRDALSKSENTWRMIQREAIGNDRRVEMACGRLEGLYPGVRVGTDNEEAEFTLTGGLGYVPITFTGLTSPRDHALRIDGQPLDQSVHGNDFWQTDYDATTQRWSQTYNIRIMDETPHSVSFAPAH